MFYNLTINEATFVILDLETTGLSAANSSVIEIAAIKYQSGMIVDTLHYLTRPREEFIPIKVTELTGITNAMVIDKPHFEKVYPEVYKFIKDGIIVAHNAKFDISFLSQVHKTVFKKNLKIPYICTDNLARRLFPEIKKKSLSSLTQYLGINFQQNHRALSDAQATLEAFKMMLDYLQDYNVNKVLDIIKLSEGKSINTKNKRKRYV